MDEASSKQCGQYGGEYRNTNDKSKSTDEQSQHLWKSECSPERVCTLADNEKLIELEFEKAARIIFLTQERSQQPDQDAFFGYYFRKSRQGRSHEVRNRAANRHRLLSSSQQLDNRLSSSSLLSSICPECYTPDNSSRSNTGTCIGCGHTYQSYRITDTDRDISLVHFRNPRSKGYLRVVHFRQRRNQLLGLGPWIHNKIINRIEDFLYSYTDYTEACPGIPASDPERWGPLSFKRILDHLGYGKLKLSRYWIQIRRRLNFGRMIVLNHHNDELSTSYHQPYYIKKNGEKFLVKQKLIGRAIWDGGLSPWEVSLSPEMITLLEIKFHYVNLAFDATLNKRTLEHYSSGNTAAEDLNRFNIINLNYIQIQLIRIESEELFQETAKFLPQLTSKNQPATNNERWKILMDYCLAHFSVHSYRDSDSNSGDMCTELKWDFIPLTNRDIELYFRFFDI